jgi:putative phosphoesterase
VTIDPPVRIGVLSDSHGRVEITRAAVAALVERECSILLHLGDLGSDVVIDELVGRNARLVLGNCDEPSLGRYAEIVGVANDHPAGRLDINGCVVAYTHGHIEREMQAALAEGVPFLLHGHTHELRDERIGSTRVINPGALHRAARYTAAVLEPATGRLEIVELPRPRG